MTIGLAHAAVTARDMKETLDFYTGALGLKKAFDIANPADGSPWIVYLLVGEGQFLELFYGGREENPWNEGQMGFNHLCLAVDDIHRAAEQVAAAGYPLDIRPKQGADGNWQCWVTDPNGVRVELMQISPESPQARAGKMGKQR